MRAYLRNLPAAFRGFDPVRVDTAVAAVLLTLSLLAIGSASPHDAPEQVVVVVSLAVGVAVRRRWLLQGLVLVAVAFLATAVNSVSAPAGPGGWQGSLMALLLFYGTGAYLSGPRSYVALALGVVLTSVSALSDHGQVVPNLLWNDVVLAGFSWLVGRLVRDRGTRARAARARVERLDAEHEMHSRLAALAERARLAREIHDVIAHSVSVMVIQAAGARTVMNSDPDRAQQALMSVERAGREALAEMRRLLGVLGDAERLRELAPQPGIEDLHELIARTRAAGLAASMNVVGEPVAVPPGLSLCAYRVVQEALTNTIKHANGARAEVLIRWQSDLLELEVADDGHGASGEPAVGSGGHGLIGMRERTALHGGEVQTGPGNSGGFAVRARIPLGGLDAG